MNPLLTKVVGLFTGGEGKLVGAIGKVADSLITSKEEKEQLKIELAKVVNAHTQEMGKQAIQETESYLKDVQDARQSNVKIQGDKPSWMAKNVAYIIDLFVFLIWGAMTIYIICKFLNIIKAQEGVDFSGILGIYSGITAIAMTVLNFHRGSSRGSEDKQKQINEFMKEGK